MRDERKIIDVFVSFLDKFIQKETLERGQTDEIMKFRFLVGSSLFIMAFGFLYTLLIKLNPALCGLGIYLAIFGTIISSLVVISTKYLQSYMISSAIFSCIFLFLVPVTILFDATIQSPTTLYLTIIPILFSFLFGIKRGAFITGISLLFLVLVFGYFGSGFGAQGSVFEVESLEILIAMSTSISIILGLTLLFEVLRFEKENDLKNEKNRAENSEKIKTEFLANLSHEIRTPLNAVVGSCEIIRDGNIEQQVLLENLKIITDSSDHLLEIITNVIEISRIESGEFKLDVYPFEVDDMVYESVDQLLPAAESKGNKLKIYFKGDAASSCIKADKRRIQKIIYALVSNAVKFTHDGKIDVNIILSDSDKEENQRLKVVVIDTGLGIKDDIRDKIWDKFYQGDSSSTKSHGGTGLGLAICKSLIHSLDGNISFRDGEEKGTVFEISVPVKHVNKVKKSDSEFVSNVCVVDDSEFTRDLMASFLNKQGLTNKLFDSAESFLEANDFSFRFFIVDKIMPGKSGLELAPIIREKNPNAIIVMLTVDTSAELENTYSKYGIDKLLSKPVRRNKLLAIVDSHKAEVKGEGKKTMSDEKLVVLVVDDAENNRNLFSLYLKSANYEVECVENGLESVEAVKKKDYHLILMDIQMPVMDGLTAIKEIREWEAKENKKETSIVIVTAHDTDEYRRASREFKTSGFLTKPIKKKRFLKDIEELKYKKNLD